MRHQGLICGLLPLWALAIFCHSVVAMVAQASTNLASAAKNLPSPDVRQHASALDRSGQTLKAAALYEEIARTNLGARKVLSGRLVAIYTEIGNQNKALLWAREAMREQPDPQSYLASVYEKLGQTNAAVQLLGREIRANTNITRAVALRWQLSDLYIRAGDATKARQSGEDAARLAKGTPLEAAAEKRLRKQNHNH